MIGRGQVGLYVRYYSVPYRIVDTTRDDVLGVRVNENGKPVRGEGARLLRRGACREVAFDLKHLSATGEKRLMP